MKKTIWKFKFKTDNYFTLDMPIGAEILTVQIQSNLNPCIWALVDPSQELETRFFEVYGTGQDIDCNISGKRKYIGTYQFYNGDLIFHLFERIN